MQDGLTLRFQTRAFTLWLRRRRARSHEETVAQRAHAMQTLAAIVAHWRTRRDAQCRAELGASAAAAQSLCVYWLQYWRHAAVAARECRRRDAAALRTALEGACMRATLTQRGARRTWRSGWRSAFAQPEPRDCAAARWRCGRRVRQSRRPR